MTRQEIEKNITDSMYTLIKTAMDQGTTGQLLLDISDTKKQILIIVTPLVRPPQPNVFEATNREIN